MRSYPQRPCSGPPHRQFPGCPAFGGLPCSATAIQQVLEEEAEKEAERKHQLRIGRLRALFRDVDTDCSGAISSQEWDALLMDKGLLHELSDAAALDRRDLQDLLDASGRARPRAALIRVRRAFVCGMLALAAGCVKSERPSKHTDIT